MSMGFRGRNPPASLKHASARVNHRATCFHKFPGEKSPGLIEALLRTKRKGPCRRLFPGEKSPGLIEAGAACRPRRDAGRFRGRNPPASLKPVGGIVLLGGSRVSGGEIPRPH